MKRYVLIFLLGLFLTNCAKESPFISGIIRRSEVATMTSCDPYNDGKEHTCVVYNPLFSKQLVVFDATLNEMVLAPIRYFPLRVNLYDEIIDLVAPKSKDGQKVPYLLALEAESKPSVELDVVRTFPTKDGTKLSFSNPSRIRLIPMEHPYKIAAYLADNKSYVLFTIPDKKQVWVIALDAEATRYDDKFAPDGVMKIPVGTKPSHIEIDDGLDYAVVSDEGENNIHVLDLSTLRTNPPSPPTVVAHIDVKSPTSKLSLAKRKFGSVAEIYALLLGKDRNKLVLANISRRKHESDAALKDEAEALYFPKEGSPSCCGGVKNWAQVACANGRLTYLEFVYAAGKINIKEKETVDAKLPKFMNLGQLRIAKMIGGQILSDPAVETRCSRKIFYVSSYGSSRVEGSLFPTDSVEVEAQGMSCEGEPPMRLGAKKID